MSSEKRILRRDILLLFLLIGVFLLTRLVNLLKVPIFTDEAIYMRWAQIALHDASWRFISLTDGKQPLFIWFSMIVMKYLGNPLLSGRLVSVVAGLFGMIGSFFLGREIFGNKRIGYFSALFYFLSPFFLWYDRMALMDSLLACFYIWSLYFEILLVRRLRLDVALILGLTLGGTILTKTSGFFAIYLLPIILLLFNFPKRLPSLLKFIGLSAVAIILSLSLYNILRLSPWFHMISQKDHSFIYTFSEIRESPWQYFWGNLRGLSIWWYSYFTLPFIILLIVGLGNKDKKTIYQRVVLFLFFLLPFVALAIFGKVLYPRFILFMTAPLLPVVAAGFYLLLETFKKGYLKTLLVISLSVYPLYFGSQIILNPVGAPIPSSDRKQYLDDWPSGFGVAEVIEFLKVEKEKQPIFVATEGTFGLFPYALELEFFSDPKINIRGYWPLPKQEVVKNHSEGRPAYLILKESQSPPPNWQTEILAEYKRGKGDTYLKFYKLIH